MGEDIRNGDLVLVESLGQGWVSASIRLGAQLRYGRGSPHARYAHVALVYDAAHQDPAAVKIVEATASRGVRQAYLSKYASRCTVVHTGIDPSDWEQMKAFLDRVLQARTRYGLLTYAGLTLYALTGTKLCLQTAGTATCSGLVCDALTRAGFIWTRPPYACTPADVHADLERPELLRPVKVPRGAFARPGGQA